MGLFSFMKNAGAKIFKSKKQKEKEAAAEAAETAEAAAQAQAEVDAQKAVELENLIKALGFEVDNLYVEAQGENVIVHGQTSDWATKEKVVLTVGNVEGVAQVDDRMEVVTPTEEAATEGGDTESGTIEDAPKTSTFHTVIKGDTLSKIAKQYYGNAMKYPVIFEANKPMLKDPDLIYVGQVLRVPALEEESVQA